MVKKISKAQKEAAEKLQSVRQKFADFLANNPTASINQGGARAKFHYILGPWNDSSVIFFVPGDPTRLADALNNLILPPRLSAVFHRDTGDLEIIFTAQKLSEPLKELRGRKFSFQFRGREHSCEFTKSSQRLMTLAKSAAYPQNSDTLFRNLKSFTEYSNLLAPRSEREKRVAAYYDEPLSFYVRNLEWNEDVVLETLRHISFYLRYYDTLCPFILIHPPDDDQVVTPQTRYPSEDKFPGVITSVELNPILLSFWIAGADEEPDLKFLHYYRIIEFVTTFYLNADKMNSVRRLLSTPDLASRIASATDTLVSLIREDKPDPYGRFQRVVSDLVDKDDIWREICANPWAFTERVVFDGGYVQEALVSNTANIECFGPQGLSTLARHFRSIRNALAHGGEAQSGEVILPTAANLKRLQPWVHLISVAAGQVVLFEHTA